MADKQLGNVLGVAAVGGNNRDSGASSKLANVTADGVNTVTVDDVEKIRVGMAIDIVDTTDGSVLATNRTVDTLTSAGVLTYSGADETATTDHAVYPTGEYGNEAQNGYTDADSLNIADLRRRLKVIDSGLYTDAYLDMMTKNDMVYAVRVSDGATTIKQ